MRSGRACYQTHMYEITHNFFNKSTDRGYAWCQLLGLPREDLKLSDAVYHWIGTKTKRLYVLKRVRLKMPPRLILHTNTEIAHTTSVIA